MALLCELKKNYFEKELSLALCTALIIDCLIVFVSNVFCWFSHLVFDFQNWLGKVTCES